LLFRKYRALLQIFGVVLGVCLLLGSRAEAVPEGPSPALAAVLAKLPDSLRQNETLRLDLNVLLSTYGNAIKGVEVSGGNRVYLIMQDGQKIVYDDGRHKNFEEKLDHPDLEDMLSQPYRPGRSGLKVFPDEDPGRIRVEAFFNAVYGTTAAQVRDNLVPVAFAGTTTSFNSRNGAAAALAKVEKKLSYLLSTNPGLGAWIFPLKGSYNRRSIAGTDRLSAHSWGIALDLHKGTYWRWSKVSGPAELLALRSEYPWEIIAAFEEQGFIWGGKWYHFDTMHFEYRPELLAKARLAPPGR
jgi:hypothetical protein